MKKTIKVYSPKGVEEEHSFANARDLVQGAGYSYQPGVAVSPAATNPHADRRPRKKSIAEEIFSKEGVNPRTGQMGSENAVDEDESDAEAEETTRTPDAEEAGE